MILTKKQKLLIKWKKFINSDAKLKELKDKLNKKNNDIIKIQEIIKDLEKKSIEKMVEQKDRCENQIKEIKDELPAYYSNMRKKDEKVRTFAPPDNASMPSLEIEEEAAENIADIYEQGDTRKKDKKVRTFAPPDNANIPLLETEEEVGINLNDIEDLNNEIINDKDMISIINNLKKHNVFNDIIKFIDEIKKGNINNSNKEEAYKNRISKNANNIRNMQDTLKKKLYIKYIDKLKDIIFKHKISKKEETTELDENRININGYNIYGYDRYGYNINVLNIFGVNKDGFNINGLKGTIILYIKRKSYI